jgi:demethylmenaquinone methyltransferase/2-methoxy-6-polyprenyl-1,4-benzoquinol methylase
LVEIVNPSKDGQVLDLCSGTGEVTVALARRVTHGKVTGVDFCPDMFARAKEKLTEEQKGRINFVLGDAMNLNFPSDFFDNVTMAFALRNVEDIVQVLQEMKRVVKPGKKIFTLDLAKPPQPIFRTFYHKYFNYIVPLLGKIIHGRREPYEYLIKSLKSFPDQETLKDIFVQVGFKRVNYFTLSWGIAAIHTAEK